jgi:hypothetical protein
MCVFTASATFFRNISHCEEISPTYYHKCTYISTFSFAIFIVVYVFLDAATLTEVFPCFFLCCKANARV